MSFEFEWEVERDDGDYDFYTFEIDYDYIPGEPPVMFFPDGSGDPGCGPEVEGVEVTLIKVAVEGKEREPSISERNEWEPKFKKHIDANWNTFFDLFYDDIEKQAQSAEADYWDRKYEEMREEGLL